MVVIKDKLKLKIAENNSQVLPIFIRDIGENLKSGEDIALVRFDAYADFLVPNDVQADEMESIDHLLDSINNHCWIMPAVYRGYVKKIFWFKPPWSHQFLDGVYTVQVGKCQQTGLLKVASTYPYFTSNCVYSPIDKLSNVRTVEIYVSTAGLAKNYSTTIDKSQEPIYDDDSSHDNADSEQRKKAKLSSADGNHAESINSKRIYPIDATLINQLLETKQFFVDVDVSFFSTDDPIRKRFDENEYEILRYVYTRIAQDRSEHEILQYIGQRENALEQIRRLMSENLTDNKADPPNIAENLYLSALIGIIRYKNIDWKSVHQYGTYLSDTRPPLHVSSEGMIIYLVESMARVLQSIKKDPILITVSRCVDDGFCSAEQADLIQSYVEQKMQNLYKIDEVIGKSVSRSSMQNCDDSSIKKSPKNDTENGHRIKNEPNSDVKLNSTDSMKNNKIGSVKNEFGSTLTTSSSMNQRSPSPSKSNLSPGEVKPISPTSLSDASPI